jgi:hypothetical protein
VRLPAKVERVGGLDQPRALAQQAKRVARVALPRKALGPHVVDADVGPPAAVA